MRKINNLEVWRFFVEAVDSGGISAAADKLGVETSSVSRALRTLESEIGAALWERSVRPARLTSLGEEVYLRVRELLAQHASLESFLFEDLNVMEGPIRICSQTGLIASFMVDQLVEFMRIYPDVHIEVFDQTTTLEYPLYATGVQRCDIVMGYAPSHDDPNLVKRYCSTIPYIACASRAYVKEFGSPATPADCFRHRGILVNSVVRTSVKVLSKNGVTMPLPWKSTMVLSNPIAAARALSCGAGIVPDMSLYHAHQHLESGDWQIVMPGWQRPSVDAFLYTTEETYRKRRIRTLIDWLSEHNQKIDKRLRTDYPKFFLH